MRGLGIGIILTTLIFVISGYQKKPTDEEIIRLAKGLGMTMADETEAGSEDPLGKVLEDIKLTPAPTQDPAGITPIPTPSQNPEESNEPTVTPSPELTQSSSPGTFPEPTETLTQSSSSEPTQAPKAPEPTKEPSDSSDSSENKKDAESDTDEVTFTIHQGMTSAAVSQLLYELGLVDSATDFDKFIIREGKSRVINIGTYRIRKGTSYEKIIKIITN